MNKKLSLKMAFFKGLFFGRTWEERVNWRDFFGPFKSL